MGKKAAVLKPFGVWISGCLVVKQPPRKGRPWKNCSDCWGALSRTGGMRWKRKILLKQWRQQTLRRLRVLRFVRESRSLKFPVPAMIIRY